MLLLLFFFNDTATTEIYTLSLHDALPIYHGRPVHPAGNVPLRRLSSRSKSDRSEEHTSELQSHSDLVCRLLLEKKNRRSASSSRCSIQDNTGATITSCARGV